MIRLLRFLWTGVWKVCDHQWEYFTTIENGNTGLVKALAMKCKHCGNIKKVGV
jgi:hypothetical protein